MYIDKFIDIFESQPWSLKYFAISMAIELIGDAIWRHRSGSTLSQVMARFLKAITQANIDVSSNAFYAIELREVQ